MGVGLLSATRVPSAFLNRRCCNVLRVALCARCCAADVTIVTDDITEHGALHMQVRGGALRSAIATLLRKQQVAMIVAHGALLGFQQDTARRAVVRGSDTLAMGGAILLSAKL